MGKRKQNAPRRGLDSLNVTVREVEVEIETPPSKKQKVPPKTQEAIYSQELDDAKDAEFAEFKLLNVRSYRCLANMEKTGIKLKFSSTPTRAIDQYKVEDVSIEIHDSSGFLSGEFDGDEIQCSSLVYLVRKKFMGLKPGLSEGTVRIFFTHKLFQTCETVPGNLLKKQVRILVTWLRPEVSADVFYGLKEDTEEMEDSGNDCFDPSALYEAVKRARDEPCLDMTFKGLCSELRTYQSQAVYWMVQREGCEEKPVKHPLWISISCLDIDKNIYYNFVSGKIAYEVPDCCARVSGGILADEMGLGKTVELLACIMANKYQGPAYVDTTAQEIQTQLNKRKEERIECICDEDHTDGIMIQCDACDAWQHATCIGYSPSRRTKKSKKTSKWKNETTYIWNDDKNFICGNCEDIISKVEVVGDCGATLIVCPTPILKQWQEEITRHTKTGALMKVLVYEGVGKGCFDLGQDVSSSVIVGAHHLAAADIVLTTYDVLRSDLHHDIEDDNSHALRFQKKYHIVATPLTRLRWWRICLDEAQMVECNTASFTDMALRLDARHKWCVTGTPIQRGLDDLYGLLKFVGAEPFDDFSCWTHGIRKPYDEGKPGAIQLAHSFLREIMWRSSKSQVIDQLKIPDQDEHISWLTFSRVEAQFYRRQHEQCARQALEVVKSFSSGNRPLNNVESSKIPLLKLRQACCHPQVGSSGIRTLQGTPMKMDEVLEVLIEKTRTEGEEALRGLFFDLNGLAGLAIAEGNIPLAISIYREALATKEENANFRVDKPQHMHTLYNLAQILQMADGSVPRTLRDDTVMDEFVKVKDSYLDPSRTHLAAVQHKFHAKNTEVAQALSEDRKLGWSRWWLDAFSVIRKNKNQQEFVDQVKGTFIDNVATNASSIALRFQDLNGLMILLQQELDAMKRGRDAMMQRLLELDGKMADPPLEHVQRAGKCGQCQDVKNGPTCVHCDMDNLFQAYEIRLLHLVTTAKDKETIVSIEDALEAHKQQAFTTRQNSSCVKPASKTTVTNRASETEQVLTMLLVYGKHIIPDELIDAAKKHLKFLELMREEYKQAKRLALAQRAFYVALDEADACITRNTLEDENGKTGFTFVEDEIPERNASLTAHKFIALADLSRVKGQYRYLKTLKKNEGDSPEAAGGIEEECPICHMTIEGQVMVLPCGHIFCCDCMKLVVERKNTKLKRFPCPTCRQGTYVGDVALAKTDGTNAGPEAEASILNNSESAEEDETSSIAVAGSYGTKIENVVRRILALREADAYVKILVFSSWAEVLDVMEHALRENKILFSRVKAKRKMDDAISKFKHTNVTVLLLPILQGANGLNLIEAQHVMLMEPLLNPAQEAQAINRVHRIGQQFKTRVHRFIMRDTVEESIYKLGLKRKTSLPMKQKEQPLSISDMSNLLCLDQHVNQGINQDEGATTAADCDTLRSLPPREAAALAAESRFMRHKLSAQPIEI